MKRSENVSEFSYFPYFSGGDAGHLSFGFRQKLKSYCGQHLPLGSVLSGLDSNRVLSGFRLRFLDPSEVGTSSFVFGS